MVDIFKAIVYGLEENLIIPHHMRFSISYYEGKYAIGCLHVSSLVWGASLQSNGIVTYGAGATDYNTTFFEYCDPELIDKLQENLTKSINIYDNLPL